MSKTYKIKTTGKSLLELHGKYGIGSDGFCSSSPWWINESFANEKPEAGEYEFSFDRKLTNKTYGEQIEKLPEGFEPVHSAIIAEAILVHFKQTGERLLEDWYVRSNTLVSGSDHVGVGDFDARGLGVNYWDVVSRGGNVGLSSARKIGALDTGKVETSESLNLEKAIEIVKEAGYKIYKEI